MTHEELKTILEVQSKRHNKEKMDILIEYAKSNNPYKIGDIIKDHIGALQIKEISFYIQFENAECIYYGTELKKDGTPLKKQSNRPLYQSNIEP